MNKVLSIKDLKLNFVQYGKVFNVLRGINLDVYEGEVISIVGETGTGKSALVKSLTNQIEDNGWVNQGSIFYYPNNEQKNIKPLDVVKYYRNSLKKDVHNIVDNFYSSRIKVMVKEIKKIETLKIQKAIAREEKLFIKLENLKIKSEFKNSNKINYQIADLYSRIKVLRRFVLLNQYEDKKNEYVKNLVNSIEELKKEAGWIRKIGIADKALLSKIVNNIIKFKNNILSWGHNEQYLFEKYYLKNYYSNDIETIVKECCNKIINEKKLSDETYNILIEKWYYYKNLVSKDDKVSYDIILKTFTKDFSYIFENPKEALSPHFSIGNQMLEFTNKNNRSEKKEKIDLVLNALKKVGFNNPEEIFKKKPKDLSDYEVQLISLAISIIDNPRLIIFDNAAKHLKSIQKLNYMNLLFRLQKELRFALMIIANDIRDVVGSSDRIAIMYAGQIVEIGNTEEVIYNSQHPYTWSLLLSLPELNKDKKNVYHSVGYPIDLSEHIVGDAYVSRNPYALKIDRLYEPPIFKVTDTHYAKTWLLDYRSPKIDRPKALVEIKKVFRKKEGK